MQAALYLTATRGLGAPEARICYERAESLCQSLDRPLLMYVALVGQWRSSLNTDKLIATMQIAERIYSLARAQNECCDNDRSLPRFGSARSTIWAISSPHSNTRNRVFRSGAQEAYNAHAEELITPAVACMCL